MRLIEFSHYGAFLVAAAAALSQSVVAAAEAGEFVYDERYDHSGLVRHYVLTNHDGTKPEYISTYFAAAGRIEAFKFHYGGPPAALVSAELDQRRFSPRRIVSTRIVPGRPPTEMATLEIDGQSGHLVSHLPPLGIRDVRDPLPTRPFAVYPFDLLTLSLSLPHLASPERGFSLDIVDANRTGVGPSAMLALGRVDFKHAGLSRRDGVRVRAFEVDGPDKHRLNGRLWIDATSGLLVEILIDRPPNPNWSTFRLKLLGSERFTSEEWSTFQSAVLAVQPPLSERDLGWQGDIDMLVETLAARHANPSHTRPLEEIRANAMDLRHRVPRLPDAVLAAEIQRILAMVGDGHTLSFVGFGGGTEQKRLPIRVYDFTDGLFVVAADPAQRRLVGRRVIRLGQFTPRAAVNALEPYVSRDNSSGMRLPISLYLTAPEFLFAAGITESPAGTDLTVATADDGEETVHLRSAAFRLDDPRRVFDEPQDWIVLGGNDQRAALQRKFWYEELVNASAAYCRINEIRDSEMSFDHFSEQMIAFVRERSIEHLIIDLRWCQGGDNTKTEELVRLLSGDPKLNHAQRLFVLIGRRTFSAAQNLATRLEQATNATFAGEPTGSRPNHYGETTLARLPYSGIAFSVSSIFWQDAPAADRRRSIAPDIAVAESSEDRAAGRDPVLQAVIRRIGSAGHRGGRRLRKRE